MAKVAKLKTTETDASVEEFLDKLPDRQQREDSLTILKLMQSATGQKPKMWGPSIIGFGNMRYKSGKTGREIDWMKMGFSPRKANISLYLMTGLEAHAASLKKLGKYKTGVGCLYINKITDIDVKVLTEIIESSAK